MTGATATLADVQAVYNGPEGRLWELIMGEQIHVGGLVSSMDLAARAGIQAGWRGVDPTGRFLSVMAPFGPLYFGRKTSRSDPRCPG